MDEMDPRIFEFLKSRDPEERKRAVKALAQIPTAESLRYLATIYKKDPDPTVRELAIKAGQHVKKLQAAGGWMNSAGTDENAVEEEYTPRYEVSAVDQQQAKGLMDKALDAVVQGNYERAEGFARKAFNLNPNLQFDSYYAGVAADIMGMEADDAIEALLSSTE